VEEDVDDYTSLILEVHISQMYEYRT
jgi:hypothetical protein